MNKGSSEQGNKGEKQALMPLRLLALSLALLLPMSLMRVAQADQTVWRYGYYYPDSIGGNPPLNAIDWSALTHVGMVACNPSANGICVAPPSWGENYLSDKAYNVGDIVAYNGFTYQSLINGNSGHQPDLSPSYWGTRMLASPATNLIAAAHANGVKVLYMLTQIGNSTQLIGACNPSNVTSFVSNVTTAVKAYGFDGVDMDWEEDWNTSEVTACLSGLRTALDAIPGPPKLLVAYTGSYQLEWISAGVPGCGDGTHGTGTPRGFNGAQIALLDKLIIGTYDQGNPSIWIPYSWFNAPLYSDPPNPSPLYLWSADYSVKGYQDCKGPTPPNSKFVLAVPFYGDIYTNNTGPRQAFGVGASTSQYGYGYLASNYSLANATYDSPSQQPWLTSGSNWISFENPTSLTAKINYIAANGLGGVAIWVLGWDYLPGKSPAYPLLDAIKKAMGPLPTYSACDVNKDGSTNVADVQGEVNQALGSAPCTNDINQDGSCNVIDVQRVVNAAMGGQCVTTP